MNDTDGVPLRIGDWRVDPASGQISRNGENVRVDVRTMRLLLCLAARAGQIVSIDDLLTQVWSGVIVTQDSVYQAVASLRRVLRDDIKQPRYIATVPRLGYRMVAPVSPWVDEPAAPLPAPELAAAPRPGTPRRAPALLVGAAALCIALAGAFLLYRNVAGRQLASVTTSRKSVAVLPFLDLTSQQMNEEVFADGMTEELIDKLSKIPGLQVPSPTSSFYFKGQHLTVAEMAKALGVNYIVDGSVRKSDATLRVAARLVRARDGYVVWTESYDRALNDKLQVQDDIASEVAKALKDSIN